MKSIGKNFAVAALLVSAFASSGSSAQIWRQPTPDPGQAFQNALDRGLQQQRQAREAQNEEERLRIEREQLLIQRQQLELQRQQAMRSEQVLKEATKRAVAEAILEGRCDEAKRIALRDYNLELADQATRLCVPRDNASIGSKPASSKAVPAKQSATCKTADRLLKAGKYIPLEELIAKNYSAIDECSLEVLRYRETLRVVE